MDAPILEYMKITNDMSQRPPARVPFLIAFALNAASTLAGILFLPLDRWQERLFPAVGVLTIMLSTVALLSHPQPGGRHRSR